MLSSLWSLWSKQQGMDCQWKKIRRLFGSYDAGNSPVYFSCVKGSSQIRPLFHWKISCACPKFSFCHPATFLWPGFQKCILPKLHEGNIHMPNVENSAWWPCLLSWDYLSLAPDMHSWRWASMKKLEYRFAHLWIWHGNNVLLCLI